MQWSVTVAFSLCALISFSDGGPDFDSTSPSTHYLVPPRIGSTSNPYTHCLYYPFQTALYTASLRSIQLLTGASFRFYWLGLPIYSILSRYSQDIGYPVLRSAFDAKGAPSGIFYGPRIATLALDHHYFVLQCDILVFPNSFKVSNLE